MACRDKLRIAHRKSALWFVIVALATSFLVPLTAAAQVTPTRRVLILNEVGTSFPVINRVDEGIRTALAKSPYRIEYYREYMETVLFPDPSDQQRFRDFYLRKYQNRKPDVIITVGSSPLRFMAETHQKNFPGVPITFCFPNAPADMLTLDSDFAGVEGDISPAATVAVALRLLPNTLHVVVVGGVSPYDRRQQATIKDQLKSYQGHLDISYLTDLPASTLVERLRHLPDRTFVLLAALGKDSAGRSFNADEYGPMVVNAANAPVFSLVDTVLNHGEVGGDISSTFAHGKAAGEVALRMLNGEKPEHIGVLKTSRTYVFDWRALERWGLNEKELPPGSIVLNRPPTVWESFKWYIIGGISILFAETLLIFGLLWERAKRIKTEKALAAMGRRLLGAHEEERASIGRELHDDINQQIALTTVRLDQLQQHLPEGAAAFHDDIRQRLCSLGSDVRALSHRLHSSKLEYLGIVEAASSYCEELSQHLSLKIDFSHSGIPREVPNEVSLCLFRILQEALQNAVKHSGVRDFRVELRGTSREIELGVSDSGCGFDLKDGISRQGLGLVSMRERVQILNGEFSITSKPDRGTTVYARVPIPREANLEANKVSLAG